VLVERRLAALEKTIEHILPAPARAGPRPMLGFKDFCCARVILSGIEIMHTIAKGQMIHIGKIKPSAACQFYSLII
jgi:hypothetical protein